MKSTPKSLRALLFTTALMASAVPATASAAGIQTTGRQTWPGKLMLGVHPLGFALTFNNPTTAIFKLNLDFAGKLAELDKLTVWLGGEFNVGGRGNYAQVEPGVFVMLSLEKLLTIPLVPYVRGGLLGGVGIVYGLGNGPNGDATTGNFWVKLGGGIHYYLTKNIGLGGEMNLGFGAGIASANGVTTSTFSGFWELVVGARFAF
jgi:hypothetical protein